MPSKKEVPVVDPKPADRLLKFIKDEKLTLEQNYTLHIVEKYKNVIPQSVIDAINLGMISAKLNLTVKDAKGN